MKRLQIVFDNSMNSMQRVGNKYHSLALLTSVQKVHRERRVWGRLDHPNIVPMYGFAEGEELFGPLGALISPVIRSIVFDHAVSLIPSSGIPMAMLINTFKYTDHLCL